MWGERREEVRVRVDGEVRRRREEGEVMLDDGVMEREGGGGREGRLEEEGSVEGDARRRECLRETRPLLWVEMFKIHLHPSLPVLLLFLLSPHPLLAPLLLLLLYPFPLHLFLLLLLSLLLNVSLLLRSLCTYTHERNSFRHIRGINNSSTVITINDMITVKMITLTTVSAITAASINTCVSFVLWCILLTEPTFGISLVLTCVLVSLSCCFLILCLLVLISTVVSVCIISATGANVF